MIRNICLFAAALFGAVAIGSGAPAIANPVPQAPYPNCTVAKQNGDCDIPSSSDKYQAKLDRDGDGLGCEC
ncbi:MAG: excalibur calcium-binding domain-containing protein [Mycobacterium sp.]|nr:excalibur calcium-binding domain-containing protein [Mycobacterium sp.]